MKTSDPFRILTPNERWAPTQSQMDTVQNVYEQLLPPLVPRIRQKVAAWREDNYPKASATTHALLNFWFNQEHLLGQIPFRFFFSQREAIESIIYLYEVAKARDKYELLRFDASGYISRSHAPAWECRMDALASLFRNAGALPTAFPRRRVGTRK
jgi:type III restriction enzyme